MSDGQDQHDSKQDQRDMMRAIKDQASITMKVANFSFNQDFLNSSDSIPSVDGLVDQRVNFLFDRTNRLYGFPNASTTFDAGVMGTKMVENFEEFLLTFADCMSRFDSAFRILKDSKGKMVHHPTLVWTEIDAYISRFGTERLVKTEYTEDDFNDEKMDIPPDDQGKRWKAMVLVHRDFAMAATFFSQAMDYVYGVCVENDSRC